MQFYPSFNFNYPLDKRTPKWFPKQSKEILKEEPFIKDQLKKAMERKLEERNIRVLKDVGIVQYG